MEKSRPSIQALHSDRAAFSVQDVLVKLMYTAGKYLIFIISIESIDKSSCSKDPKLVMNYEVILEYSYGSLPILMYQELSTPCVIWSGTVPDYFLAGPF